MFGKSRTVAGLDIGSSAVKAVELKAAGKGYRVAAFGMQPVPSDSIVDGAIMDAGAVADAIRRVFESTEAFKAKDVCASLSGNAVIVKKITLPLMTQSELDESIYWEAEQFIPFEVQDVNLDYQILDPGTGPESRGSMEVLLVAAKKEKIGDYTGVIAGQQVPAHHQHQRHHDSGEGQRCRRGHDYRPVDRHHLRPDRSAGGAGTIRRAGRRRCARTGMTGMWRTSIWLLTIALASSSLAAQPPLAQASAPQGREAQPVPPAPAGRGATPPPTEPPGFSYNPEGRRDPFVSLMRRGTGTRGGTVGGRSPGLAGLEVAEVTLRGTVRSREGFVAMLQGADQRTYIVRAGDKLFDGTVRTISQNDIVILQQVNDPLSLEKQREVRKVLRQAEAN